MSLEREVLLVDYSASYPPEVEIPLEKFMEMQLDFGAIVLGRGLNSITLYSADTSKTNPQKTEIYPKRASTSSLANVEIAMDKILYAHWSPHEDTRRRWPRLSTVTDPNNGSKKEYKIVEFPIIVGKDRILSIKESVIEANQMTALRYTLAAIRAI